MSTAKVKQLPEDKICTSFSCIDNGTVQRILRSGRFGDDPSFAPQSAAVANASKPTAKTSMSAASSSGKDTSGAGYGFEVWVSILAGQIEEILTTIKSMQDTIQKQSDLLSGFEVGPNDFGLIRTTGTGSFVVSIHRLIPCSHLCSHIFWAVYA